MSVEEKEKEKLKKAILNTSKEISTIKQQIEELQIKQESLKRDRKALRKSYNKLIKEELTNNNNNNNNNNNKLNLREINPNNIEFYSKFKWEKDIKNSLKKVFKLNKFRCYQKEIINCTLNKRDCFVILPSGGGKSLCYQLPVTLNKYKNSITLVVSPLISLIIDQCYHLNKIGIKSAALCGSDKSATNKEIYANLSSYRLLYVTPEKISSSNILLNALEDIHDNGLLSRIVIDEAHCCSQWGHDFRPSYKKLGKLRISFKDIPILACTATATDNILKDTIKILKMNDDTVIFRGSFNRPNLLYKVIRKPSNKDKRFKLITNMINDNYCGQTGIIYTLTINECIEVFNHLKSNNISCLPYHGEMKKDIREQAQQRWLEDKCQVIIATIAFGLGINKEDVSFVIHYTLSKSMQNYYQESGRAGRDGRRSDCILLYKSSDVFNHIAPMISFSNNCDPSALLRPIMKYVYNINECRRNEMAKSFNELFSNIKCNNMCDICNNFNKYKSYNITEDGRLLNKIITDGCGKTSKSLTMTQLIATWRASSKLNKIQKLISKFDIKKLKDKMNKFTIAECEYIIGYLYANKYINIKIKHTKYKAVTVIVPGERSFALCDAYIKQNKTKIFIKIPINQKIKTIKCDNNNNDNKQIETDIDNGDDKKIETDNSTDNNDNNDNSEIETDIDVSDNDDGMNNNNNNRKRKYNEIAKTDFIDLCSDDAKIDTSESESEININNNNNNYDFSDGFLVDDNHDFDVEDKIFKIKKVKKKRKLRSSKKRVQKRRKRKAKIKIKKKKKKKKKRKKRIRKKRLSSDGDDHENDSDCSDNQDDDIKNNDFDVIIQEPPAKKRKLSDVLATKYCSM